ncbi:MAG TPA: hypothetical protein VIZ22_04085 [Candidatus Limnocylindrales bacterium]
MTAAVEVHGEATQAEAAEAWPPGDVLRDITRGGVAGVIAGILAVGLGGRLAMRLAAVAIPGSVGEFTENGNRIGAITFEGTFALVGVGLIVGVGVGFLWVVVRPWIPGGTAVRALLAMPLAVAVGSRGIIEGENNDFEILERAPVVVAILILLVMLVGLVVALVDAWLDGRLPRATARESGPAGIYAVIAAVGALMGFPLFIPGYLGQEHRWLGIALVAVGVATLATWLFRVRRRKAPAIVSTLGYGALAATAIVGLAITWSEVAFALRI